jgi:hypothetical protein
MDDFKTFLVLPLPHKISKVFQDCSEQFSSKFQTPINISIFFHPKLFSPPTVTIIDNISFQERIDVMEDWITRLERGISSDGDFIH